MQYSHASCHVMPMRWPSHLPQEKIPCLASLSFFKDTSIRDMKSKPSTPRAPVPGISPSCSGTQSPRHPHLAASCIGQRWSLVKRAKLLCQRIPALVRLALTWVCGDCVVPLALVAWLFASCLGERSLFPRFGACMRVALMVW